MDTHRLSPVLPMLGFSYLTLARLTLQSGGVTLTLTLSVRSRGLSPFAELSL